MLTYCEVIPRGRVLVLRLRYAGGARDEYDARDTETGRYVSGLTSMKAALAALGVG